MKTFLFNLILFLLIAITGCSTPDVYTNVPNSGDIKNALGVNVRTLGAKGDSKADDTPVFLTAIARAQAGGGVVLVPRGRYRISQPLELDKITLTGSGDWAWPADENVLPIIVPIHRDGPAIILNGGSSLRGIDITYVWKNEPTNGPAAILITGIGATIRDIRIRFA